MAGFEVYNDDGVLVIDDVSLSYYFKASGSGTTITPPGAFGNTVESYAAIQIPEGGNPFIAVSCSALISMVRVLEDAGMLTFQYACEGDVGTAFSYWIFEDTGTLQSTDTSGLELFNEAGQLTFSSSANSMTVVGIMNSDGGPQTFPAGRTYAFAQPAFAGHRIAGEVLDYSSGGPQLPSDPPGDGPFRYQNNGKVYGASINGTTVTIGNVSFDDVQVTINSITPPPDWHRPLTAGMVIDVTGYV